MIDNNISQKERIEKLNQIAKRQLEIFICDKNIIEIKNIDENNKLIGG